MYAVLEDDGTEVGEEEYCTVLYCTVLYCTQVDEEEYFQLLPDKCLLMLLSGDQSWTPNFTLQG